MNDAICVEVPNLTCGWQPENRSGSFRSFFDRSGMCVANVDKAIRVVEANSDFSRQFGCPPADFGGRPFCELLHPDVRDEVGQQFAQLLDEQRAWFTVHVVALRSGDSSEFDG